MIACVCDCVLIRLCACLELLLKRRCSFFFVCVCVSFARPPPFILRRVRKLDLPLHRASRPFVFFFFLTASRTRDYFIFLHLVCSRRSSVDASSFFPLPFFFFFKAKKKKQQQVKRGSSLRIT